MKRKDIKHTALFSAFVLISIAFDLHSRRFLFHFPTASILVVVLIWLFAVAVFFRHEQSGNENAFVNGAKKGSAAILLLLCVGVIVSMWIQSGMVPMIIYYGLGLFLPKFCFFAPSCCVCCYLFVPVPHGVPAVPSALPVSALGKAWGFLLISQRALRFPEQLLGISSLPFRIQRYSHLISRM